MINRKVDREHVEHGLLSIVASLLRTWRNDGEVEFSARLHELTTDKNRDLVRAILGGSVVYEDFIASSRKEQIFPFFDEDSPGSQAEWLIELENGMVRPVTVFNMRSSSALIFKGDVCDREDSHVRAPDDILSAYAGANHPFYFEKPSSYDNVEIDVAETYWHVSILPEDLAGMGEMRAYEQLVQVAAPALALAGYDLLTMKSYRTTDNQVMSIVHSSQR